MTDKHVAIITGGGNGIGEATARLFAQNNYAVAIIDVVDRVEQVAAEIESEGGECLSVKGDVSNESDVKAFVDRVMRVYGRVDALINNAGTVVGQTRAKV